MKNFLECSLRLSSGSISSFVQSSLSFWPCTNIHCSQRSAWWAFSKLRKLAVLPPCSPDYPRPRVAEMRDWTSASRQDTIRFCTWTFTRWGSWSQRLSAETRSLCFPSPCIFPDKDWEAGTTAFVRKSSIPPGTPQVGKITKAARKQSVSTH